MSIEIVKKLIEFAKSEFKEKTFLQFIKPMSDYSLQIAQEVKADPLLCMIASVLHMWAEGKTGEFRANRANSILREMGIDSITTDKLNDMINNLLPETHNLQESLEEKVVGDAYILTYWRRFSSYKNIAFNFKISEKIFHSIEDDN